MKIIDNAQGMKNGGLSSRFMRRIHRLGSIVPRFFLGSLIDITTVPLEKPM
jgi:hypothetical protein